MHIENLRIILIQLFCNGIMKIIRKAKETKERSKVRNSHGHTGT